MQKIQFPFGVAFYLVTLLTALAFLLVLYSTFMKYKKNETNLYMFSLQETSKYFITKPNNTNVFNGLKSISMVMIVGTHCIRNSSPHSRNN